MYSNYPGMPVGMPSNMSNNFSMPTTYNSLEASNSMPVASTEFSSMPTAAYSSVPSAYSSNPNDERFGGFLAPFLLGGITGGLLAPAFYPRPVYPPFAPYPPYYGPFYR